MACYDTFGCNGFRFFISYNYSRHKDINFNTTPQNLTESPNREIVIPNGIIETIDIKNKTLTIVVKVSAGHLEILIMDLKDGILLNQYSVKQKKPL